MTIRVSGRTEVLRPQPAGEVEGLPAWAYPVGNRVGECATWHPDWQRLLWVDIRGQALFRLDPQRHFLERWDLPEVVGALAPCRSGALWLGLRHRIVRFDPASCELADVTVIEGDRPHNRLNDGKVSPTGRWFVLGSMDDRPQKEASGALYAVDDQGRARRLHDGLSVANGIAWDRSGTTLFFSDSRRGVVFRAAWDEATGCMGTPEAWARADEAQGRPDGGAVDADGLYWSAGVSAGCLNAYDASGRCVRKVALPCRAPTMPVWGGPEGRTLFVTSLVRPEWPQPGPWDGALMMIPSLGRGSAPPLLQDLPSPDS